MNVQAKKVKMAGNEPQIELHDEAGYNEKGIVSYERPSAQYPCSLT